MGRAQLFVQEVDAFRAALRVLFPDGRVYPFAGLRVTLRNDAYGSTFTTSLPFSGWTGR